MKIYRGKGIVPGIVIAPLHILGGTSSRIGRSGGAASKDEEAARYRGAAETAAAEFARLSRLTRERAGEEEAHIFDIYCVMLEDEDLGGEILRRIDEGKSAEEAVRASGDALASMLRESDSEYMRERSYDVDTVCDALLSALGGGGGSFDVAEPSVICARDLSPSETVSLDREKTLGFVTAEGGTSSHTAILARAIDIPAVVALGEMPDAGDGGICILDGGDGTLTVAPDDETISNTARNSWITGTAWSRQTRSRTRKSRSAEKILRCSRIFPTPANAVLPFHTVRTGSGCTEANSFI